MVSLKTVNYVVESVLALIILAGSIFWSWTFFSPDSLPPVKYLSIAILTRAVPPGGTIVGRVTSDRRRQCEGHTDRYVIKLDKDNGGEEQIYTDTVKATPTELGESINVIFRLKLPSDIALGLYVYRAFLHSNCDDKKWRIPVPEASFRVCAVDDTNCKD